LPRSAVTLVAGPLADGATIPNPLQQRLSTTMKAQRITVLQDVAVGMTAESVHLGCGAHLACDVPLIALESQSPAWLADSGLALDDRGQVAIDAYQRSTSHSQVFSVHDESEALVHNLPAATLRVPACMRCATPLTRCTFCSVAASLQSPAGAATAPPVVP